MSYQKVNPQNSKKHVLILDLDGTVIDNQYRQYKIYKNILVQQYPFLKSSTLTFEEYKKKNPYSILSLLPPFNDSNSQFLQIKQRFLKEFLSNKFLHFDRAYSGVDNFIRWCIDKNIYLIFLTGRIEKAMKSETLKIIERYFPFLSKQNFVLQMKKSFDEEDYIFKQNFLSTINRDNNLNIIGFIDNEADICNLAEKILQNSLIIQFKSQQSNDSFFSGNKLYSWENL
ncbi:MAG: hypothetical protein K9W44_04825 [Candidatus Lokiarchaeota archaeon]|nr:hypothetical protein [Candidatus Harpocratesius repetitus]